MAGHRVAGEPADHTLHTSSLAAARVRAAPGGGGRPAAPLFVEEEGLARGRAHAQRHPGGARAPGIPSGCPRAVFLLPGLRPARASPRPPARRCSRSPPRRIGRGTAGVKLPYLISVPHAGLRVPGLVADRCALTAEEIAADGDERAAEIYLPLQDRVARLVTTDVARAVVDLNRPRGDRSTDGAVKTQTCWGVPVYSRFPGEAIVEQLLQRFYDPYHRELATVPAQEIRCGIDAHTMAGTAPPVAPDAGQDRPPICLSNAGGAACPEPLFESLARALEESFQMRVARNRPFRGGHIIRHHGRRMPWVQLELSRVLPLGAPAITECLLRALESRSD
ncbi:MAG: hypothetical protein GF355_15300 [Candidatus Eisenbacteria bacterium]|nr:hypothetical protein [Candidatus Eisenbacteria bacterium]